MIRPRDLVVSPRGLRFAGRHVPCSVGRGGVRSTKREGDGATPRGVHHIVGMFYRPDRLPCPSDWATPIGLRDLWSDASGQPDYNHLVRAPYPHSHEKMRRADPLYDLVIITDWNWPEAQAGAGSAIFIHRWRKPGHPTEGCIGLRPHDLRWIAARLRPGDRLVVN